MLKVVLKKLASETLNTFVGGRQNLDSVIIANDCLDSRIMCMVSRLICNLDIEMANEHQNMWMGKHYHTCLEEWGLV